MLWRNLKELYDVCGRVRSVKEPQQYAIAKQAPLSHPSWGWGWRQCSICGSHPSPTM